MIAVVQRVSSASITEVTLGSEVEIARIGPGLAILLGVHVEDTVSQAQELASKIANLRVMEDEAGKLNLSVVDTGGSAIVVSNFTLCGETAKGRRPSFVRAASGAVAAPVYRAFGAALSAHGVPVSYGGFGAHMRVSIHNDGPVTLVMEI